MSGKNLTEDVETKVLKTRNYYDINEAIPVTVHAWTDNGLKHARVIIGRHDVAFEIEKTKDGNYELTVHVLMDAPYTYKLSNDYLIRLFAKYLATEDPRDLAIWISEVIHFIRRRGD